MIVDFLYIDAYEFESDNVPDPNIYRKGKKRLVKYQGQFNASSTTKPAGNRSGRGFKPPFSKPEETSKDGDDARAGNDEGADAVDTANVRVPETADAEVDNVGGGGDEAFVSSASRANARKGSLQMEEEEISKVDETAIDDSLTFDPNRVKLREADVELDAGVDAVVAEISNAIAEVVEEGRNDVDITADEILRASAESRVIAEEMDERLAGAESRMRLNAEAKQEIEGGARPKISIEKLNKVINVLDVTNINKELENIEDRQKADKSTRRDRTRHNSTTLKTDGEQSDIADRDDSSPRRQAKVAKQKKGKAKAKSKAKSKQAKKSSIDGEEADESARVDSPARGDEQSGTAAMDDPSPRHKAKKAKKSKKSKASAADDEEAEDAAKVAKQKAAIEQTMVVSYDKEVASRDERAARRDDQKKDQL